MGLLPLLKTPDCVEHGVLLRRGLSAVGSSVRYPVGFYRLPALLHHQVGRRVGVRAPAQLHGKQPCGMSGEGLSKALAVVYHRLGMRLVKDAAKLCLGGGWLRPGGSRDAIY